MTLVKIILRWLRECDIFISMNVRELLNESLISVYNNTALNTNVINEGQEDHPEAQASCVSPQQLAQEMNGELHRKDTEEKSRDKMGGADVIYHRKHIEDYITRSDTDYDVYPLNKQLKTPTGKISKKPRTVNYNKVVGSYNKETGFIPNDLGKQKKFEPGKNIPELTAMAPSAELDVNKFKELITTLPDVIFDQNTKMVKTDKGRNQLTVNTGLPAIKGIVWDEEENEFMHINTCPGAGKCQLVCYARKGFYGMNDGLVLKLIQRLNLLWNNDKAYYKMVMKELISHAASIQTPQGEWDYDDMSDSKGIEGDLLVIRWNDAGDFFSEKYYRIAQAATKQLQKLGYNVKSYAYTKQAKFVNLATDDFVMNFSKGSASSEVRQLDLEKVKFSDIVPRDLFKQVFKYKGPHVMKVDGKDDGLPVFVDGGEEKLKQIISNEYKVPLERLKYQWELPSDEGEKFKYDVIVMPTGDSDVAAQRNDVQKTFLMYH